jgi:hypothetical protein
MSQHVQKEESLSIIYCVSVIEMEPGATESPHLSDTPFPESTLKQPATSSIDSELGEQW